MNNSTLILAASAVLVSLFIGCGSSGGSTTGEVVTEEVVEQLSIALGESKSFANSHIIRSDTTAEVNGSLEADGDNGQDITIEAEGDITVSGSIMAGGSSETNPDGGTVTLISKNGDITLDANSLLQAGDGLSPSGLNTANAPLRAASLANNGRGGEGGSIILSAPNGTISIGATAGILHIGNGGDGADVEVHGEALEGFAGAGLDMRGGNSGALFIRAPSLNGLNVTQSTLNEDVVDEDGNTLYSQGDLVTIIEPTDQISGGIGGDAGDLAYGLDEHGVSTWLSTASAAPMPRRIIEYTKNGAKVTIDTEQKLIKIEAPAGGSGLMSGGNGSNLRLKGKDGTVPGGDGINVFGIGGNGGDCKRPYKPTGNSDLAELGLMLIGEGQAGDGGSVVAIGGHGAKGADPTSPGGDGGDAQAKAGNGGSAILLSGRSGKDGIAYATGGNGGDGGDGCALVQHAWTGGSGGQGGRATVWVTGFLSEGTSIARGGNGGNGNRGIYNSGAIGEGGYATAYQVTLESDIDGEFGIDYFHAVNNVQTHKGEDGIALGTCPPASSSSSSVDDIISSSSSSSSSSEPTSSSSESSSSVAPPPNPCGSPCGRGVAPARTALKVYER